METVDGIHAGAHHHQLVHLVVGRRERRQGPALRGDGHGRGHHVSLALPQVGQHIGVAVGDDDVEAQVVLLGELPHQLVFEPHLPAPVYEVGHRVVAGDHAQPAALLQPGQVVGEGLLGVAAEPPGEQVVVDARLQLRVGGPHHQGDGAVLGEHQGCGQLGVVVRHAAPDVLVGNGGPVVAADDAFHEQVHTQLLRRLVDAQGRHLPLDLQQGPVVGAGTPDADLHARQVLDRCRQGVSGLGDQVLVHVEIGQGEGGLLLPLGRDRQAGGDDVPFALQQLGHHFGEVLGFDQFQLQPERPGQPAGDVVVEGYRFAVPGQVVHRLGGDDDAQDAALLQHREVAGVPGRGRRHLRLRRRLAALDEGRQGEPREG